MNVRIVCTPIQLHCLLYGVEAEVNVTFFMVCFLSVVEGEQSGQSSPSAKLFCEFARNYKNYFVYSKFQWEKDQTQIKQASAKLAKMSEEFLFRS